jgi:ribulose-bisphosphate carboxylase large chain
VTRPDRLRVSYRIAPIAGETPGGAARRIALEQTVELPDGCYPAEIEDRSVGRLEGAVAVDGAGWRFTVSYDPWLVTRDVPQLLNLLFGNVSLLRDVEITALEFPDGLLREFAGPRFGLAGLREVCGVSHRPFLCSAAKPVGLSARELADRCAALARGGIDVVKDDHGITDQATAPFAERVERCQEAVERANAASGRNARYFPNVTGPLEVMPARVAYARSVGCRGVLVSPFLVGLDGLRWLAEQGGLAVLAHPAFAGGVTHPGHGIVPEVLFGTLLRVLGADGVILINAGGRFPVAEAEALGIAENLRDPDLPIRPALPVLVGGLSVAEIPRWITRFGSDVMFLVGGDLYAQGNLERAAAYLRQLVERNAEAGS